MLRLHVVTSLVTRTFSSPASFTSLCCTHLQRKESRFCQLKRNFNSQPHTPRSLMYDDSESYDFSQHVVGGDGTLKLEPASVLGGNNENGDYKEEGLLRIQPRVGFELGGRNFREILFLELLDASTSWGMRGRGGFLSSPRDSRLEREREGGSSAFRISFLLFQHHNLSVSACSSPPLSSPKPWEGSTFVRSKPPPKSQQQHSTPIAPQIFLPTPPSMTNRSKRQIQFFRIASLGACKTHTSHLSRSQSLHQQRLRRKNGQQHLMIGPHPFRFRLRSGPPGRMKCKQARILTSIRPLLVFYVCGEIGDSPSFCAQGWLRSCAGEDELGGN